MGVKEEDQLIQENIQEYVHDDSKIVTCKWLSLTLSIPVNSAKIALFQFVSSVRQSGNNDDINVTYFVSGFETKECGTKVLKCAVVPESHLDALKKTMDPVTSCHVYSVQKAKLMDYTPLYQADYDICRENAETLNKFSAISCPWAVLRDDRPVENRTVKDTSAQKTGNKGADVPKSSSLSSTTKSNETKDDKKATSGNKKGAGIASMFAAAGKKEKKPDNSAVSKDSKNTTSTSSKAKDGGDKKGIQAMFKGQAKKAEVKDVKTEKKTSPKQVEAPSTKQISQRKSEKGQKHKLSGSDEPQKRKRRRIRNDLFDSSDEENDKNDEDDDVDANIDVEMSDQEDVDQPKEEEEKAKQESDNEDEKSEDEQSVKEEKEVDERKTIEKQIVVKDGKRRKRTRKLVPKQHIDEDGFMVTEKVWESDSTDASDEEEAKPTTTTTASTKASSSSSPSKSKSSNAAKPAANKKKAAAVSPSKNKQTSLMSFFKKK